MDTRQIGFRVTLTQGTRWDEARDYYRLVDQARKAGIPTSLDDPRSPRTVQGLRDAITALKED